MESDAPSASATAIVVAGEEETRVLLRGLLRLHGFRVLAEADGETSGADLLRIQGPGLLIVDSLLSEGTARSLIGEARRTNPQTRIVLVGPRSGPPPQMPRDEGGPDALLERPFRVKAFAEAVGAETRSPAGA
jgi:DNA-binding response OmpR family regulator